MVKSDQYLINLSDWEQTNISSLIVPVYFRLTDSAGVYPVLQRHALLDANKRYYSKLAIFTEFAQRESSPGPFF